MLTFLNDIVFKNYMLLKYIPNILSFLRLILVLPFSYFFFHAQFQTALYIFIIAALTDALDGWIARSFNFQTEFGLLIDPLADKILIVTCFILLGYHHILPVWLVIMVLLRDFAIMIGAFISMYVLHRKHPLSPSMLSKLNTLLQMLLIVTSIFSVTYHQIPQAYLSCLHILVGLTTLSSFFHYLMIWYIELESSPQ